MRQILIQGNDGNLPLLTLPLCACVRSIPRSTALSKRRRAGPAPEGERQAMQVSLTPILLAAISQTNTAR